MLGKMSAGETLREPQGAVISDLSVRGDASAEFATPQNPAITISPSSEAQSYPGAYVASKNGTRYYLPWCSGVKRIKEENKVWFNTREEAVARGLLPAANCPGI